MLKRNLFLAVAVIQSLFVLFVLLPVLWGQSSYVTDIAIAVVAALSGMILGAGFIYRFLIQPEL